MKRLKTFPPTYKKSQDKVFARSPFFDKMATLIAPNTSAQSVTVKSEDQKAEDQPDSEIGFLLGSLGHFMLRIFASHLRRKPRGGKPSRGKAGKPVKERRDARRIGIGKGDTQLARPTWIVGGAEHGAG